MVVDSDSDWAGDQQAPVAKDTPPPPPPASEGGAPAEAIWGQRSLSLGGGCLFFTAGCALFGGLLVLLVLISGGGEDAGDSGQDLTRQGDEEGAGDEVTADLVGLQKPVFEGGPPASSQPGSGPRKEGLSFGGPRLKTLHEIALDELGRLGAKGRQNEAGQYVEVELRGGVYDNDLKQSAQLKALQTLHLNDTHVSGEGCKWLVRLESLQELDLAGSPITDRGLQQVVQLVGLRKLDLRDTRVSLDGVLSLNKLPDLKTLLLSPGQLSQRRLRGRLPGCNILWRAREKE